MLRLKPSRTDRGGCFPAAIVAPSRFAHKVRQFVTPWCRPEVLKYPHPFVKHAPQQVEGSELPDNPVADFLAIYFFGKGPEHAIPDDENTRIIAVKIAGIGRVMHTMMAWGVHDIFEPAREFADGLGMDPELIDKVKRADEEQHCRVKPDERQRNAEDKAKGNEPGPCLSQRRGKIIMLA